MSAQRRGEKRERETETSSAGWKVVLSQSALFFNSQNRQQRGGEARRRCTDFGLLGQCCCEIWCGEIIDTHTICTFFTYQTTAWILYVCRYIAIVVIDKETRRRRYLAVAGGVRIASVLRRSSHPLYTLLGKSHTLLGKARSISELRLPQFSDVYRYSHLHYTLSGEIRGLPTWRLRHVWVALVLSRV